MTPTTQIAAVIEMMQLLSEATQQRVVEHLRDFLADLADEADWDALFAGTQHHLAAEGHRVRLKIEQGLAEPLDYERL